MVQMAARSQSLVVIRSLVVILCAQRLLAGLAPFDAVSLSLGPRVDAGRTPLPSECLSQVQRLATGQALHGSIRRYELGLVDRVHGRRVARLAAGGTGRVHRPARA